MAFFWFEMDFFSFKTYSYRQVGPPFIGSGQQLMPGISSYYQRLRAVGKSGGGWWGDMGRKCPIVWDRVNWYVKILGCLSAPNNPPNPGSDSPRTFKLSPGLHKNKGQSYLPLRERTLAPINEYVIVQNKHRPYDYWLKIWGLQPYQIPLVFIWCSFLLLNVGDYS